MMLAVLLLGLATTGRVGDLSVADVVVLRDGSILRGQFQENAPLGAQVFLVRRSWVTANLPARARRWALEEAPRVRTARIERKDRLFQWRRERRGTSLPGDPVQSWIDREIATLSTFQPANTPLMAVTLARYEVKSVRRRDAETARLLRLGWLEGINEVESLTAEELENTLDAMGKVGPDVPDSVEALLPLYPESEFKWRTRRAATEVAFEPGLRYVQFRQLVLQESDPEDASPRDTTELIDSPAGRAGFGAIQAVTPFDELKERQDDAAERDRIGVIMTRASLSVDSDRIDVETTFWVRGGKNDWRAVTTKKAQGQLGKDVADASPRAEGVPLKTALRILEAVASRPSPPEESRLRERLSRAGELTLEEARAALLKDVAPLVFNLNPVRAQRRGAPR